MFYVTIFAGLLAIVSAKISITHVYFDPTTSVTKERRDGVVIVESANGYRSTICNDNFQNEDAMVVCRMMGYSDDENSFALMSSKSSYKHNQIYFSNFTCQGNESTLENCPTFEYKLAESSCQGHEKDVHVYCNSPRIVSKQYTGSSKSECDPDIAELKQGNERMGLMTLKSGNSSFTLCGIKNNFGKSEAQLFCKLLCFKNVKSARIISNYAATGSSIGGFRNMKCPMNANTLNDCTNVYSDDSELCTPADNIGVACESQLTSPEPKPVIMCQGDIMVLKWDQAVFPEVQADYVNILDNGANCTDVQKETADGFVSLKLKLDNCNPFVSENKESLIFRHRVQRVFPIIQNIVGRNTQNFDATCFISRKEIVGDTNINLQNIDMAPAGSIVNLETKLELSTSFDFAEILQMPYSLKIGTRIYARITLLEAPAQIQLVLQKCVLYNQLTDTEVLIEERCAVRSDVKINPINDNVIKFNYKSFGLRRENLPLSIRCETSKCGKSEIGCISGCQKP